MQDSSMEVDGMGGGDVVKTGTKRTHSGELANSPHFSSTSSPHPQTTPTSSAGQDSSSSAGSLLALIAKVFRVAFLVSFTEMTDYNELNKHKNVLIVSTLFLHQNSVFKRILKIISIVPTKILTCVLMYLKWLIGRVLL